MLANKEHPNNTRQNGADGAQNPFRLQDLFALRDIVRERHDH